MKHKVKALHTYKELNIKDVELGKVPEAEEEFEVSDERLEILLGNNSYKRAFVEVIADKVETATAKKKTIEKNNAKTRRIQK